MRKVVKLHNVIDTRTGRYHSVAIVFKEKAKYFRPAPENVENIQDQIEPAEEIDTEEVENEIDDENDEVEDEVEETVEEEPEEDWLEKEDGDYE